MAELFIELLSEEIPARMQARAAADLESLVTAALKDAGLGFGKAVRFATPRRLALAVEDVAERQEDRVIERRGPRVDAPEKARAGFLSSLGTEDYELAEQAEKKGTFIVARFRQAGRSTAELLADAMPEILQRFPWPKSMRWGDGEARWVRPLHRVTCLLGGKVVPFEFAGISASNRTLGHRFHAPDEIEIEDSKDWRAKLKAAFVEVDPAVRRAAIEARAGELARSVGCRLRHDPRLLDELAGLVEHPVPVLGRIDDSFMELPQEVLVTSMREHQKYLALETEDGALAPHFVTIANLDASDGGAAIRAGNERVLRARLWDARFFWDQDLKASLESRLPALSRMVFHARLGSLGEKVDRMVELSGRLCATTGADKAMVERAAMLAKCDLVSGMVGEFPELQGVMGGYYARAAGEDEAIAEAIASHYRPAGPGDACPSAPVAVTVALADKLDTLAGFFAVGITPTGSKDPFALRRAALGVIRLVVENGLRLDLDAAFRAALAPHSKHEGALETDAVARTLREFFIDRLKVQQRDAGVRHDLIEAVVAARPDADLVGLLASVEALQGFVESADGANLLAGYKRAANILRIEEKKDGVAYAGAADAALFADEAERALKAALDEARPLIEAGLEKEDFAGAMAALAALRPAVDRFFEDVLVNVEDATLRRNRLELLALLRASFTPIADFSLIES